jgi:hypothetical protein
MKEFVDHTLKHFRNKLFNTKLEHWSSPFKKIKSSKIDAYKEYLKKRPEFKQKDRHQNRNKAMKYGMRTVGGLSNFSVLTPAPYIKKNLLMSKVVSIVI